MRGMIVAFFLVVSPVSSAEPTAIPPCAANSSAVNREALFGHWTWSDRKRNGTVRHFLVHLRQDGTFSKEVRAFPANGTKYAGTVMKTAVYGRWGVVGSTYFEIEEGVYFAGDTTKRKIPGVADDGPNYLAYLVQPKRDQNDPMRDEIAWAFVTGEPYVMSKRVEEGYVLPR